jgi:imidazolonepropionase-like amidohydrolase
MLRESPRADGALPVFARSISIVVVCVLAAPLSAQAPPPAPAPPPAVTVLTDVRIFDGKAARLSGPSHVLVRGNRIERISSTPIAPDKDTQVIEGGQRTLMPGLIDMHWHAMLVRPSPAVALGSDPGYTNLLAGAEATDTLMRGFTTVRDVGGPAFSLKRAIDEGIVVGPRIFPSGAMITVTSGHGDFRQFFELPRVIGGPPSRTEVLGAASVADTPDEVRIRVREQLMQGATQIKLTAGGGVSSPHSPLDVSTFTEPELRAAVEAAENWGTYVTVHAFTPVAVQRAISAGVRCIEHAFLMDEASAKLMAERGIWLSLQPIPPEMVAVFPPGSVEAEKFGEALAGVEKAYAMAKKYKLKTAFGTDILFSPELAPRQGALLASLARWYTPAEVLIMGTRTNAQLLEMSGKRNPYPAGKLGVVEEGALADLLLVDGNPIENIKLIEDPARNFVLIMKDGKIYKNTL